MEKSFRKRFVGILLHHARELVLKAWEDHGTALPQPAYEACQKAVEAIMDAELEVLRWDTK